MTKIIGIVGFKNSGKDTIGSYISEKYGYTKDSFANPLKDAISSIFSWDREMIEGASKESRIWREEVDMWWADKLHIPDFTPRLAMQLIGTEVLRSNFHTDIWILSFKNRMKDPNTRCVLTDARFKNELISIREMGGILINVMRDKPTWWYDALAFNAYPNQEKPKSLEGIHETELSWIGFDFDYYVNNTGTLDELYKQVDEIFN